MSGNDNILCLQSGLRVKAVSVHASRCHEISSHMKIFSYTTSSKFLRVFGGACKRSTPPPPWGPSWAWDPIWDPRPGISLLSLPTSSPPRPYVDLQISPRTMSSNVIETPVAISFPFQARARQASAMTFFPHEILEAFVLWISCLV